MGTVWAVPIRKGRWGAVQLLGHREDRAVLGALAPTFVGVPALEELVGVPLLRAGHHLHAGDAVVLSVPDEPLPLEWLVLGTLATTCPSTVRAFGAASGLSTQIRAQYEWDHETPPKAIEAFREAVRSKERVRVSIGGSPVALGRGLTRLTVRAGGTLEPVDAPAWQALDALPALLELHVSRADPALEAWLASRPLLSTLQVDAADTLDVRGARLSRLAVGCTGAGPIRIGEALRSLVLTAHAPRLVVEAPGASDLHVTLRTEKGPWPEVVGLRRVRSLIASGPTVDLEKVADAFPELTSLSVLGERGSLSGLSALARLPLRDLHVHERTFDPAAIVHGAALAHVEISGYRRSHRAQLEQAFARVAHLELRGPRADAVLDRDADCPFVTWSDDGAALGAAAIRAWRAAKKSLARDPRAAIEALVKALNRLDATHGLDTVRREEALEAVAMLGRSSLGEREAIAIFERQRSF